MFLYGRIKRIHHDSVPPLRVVSDWGCRDAVFRAGKEITHEAFAQLHKGQAVAYDETVMAHRRAEHHAD